MPRVTVVQDNKIGGDSERFPSLKLNSDERARIACLDMIKLADGSTQIAPMQEFVHTLKAPKIVDGRASREVRKSPRDGSTFEDWAYEFIGQPLCLGAEAILREQGRDVSNCPVCAASAENPHIEPPRAMFAMNIVRYGTRPGGWELAEPFSAHVIAWKFPASRFDRLCDIARDDAPEGNLSRVDLKLGPCKDSTYQKYDIGVITNTPAVWTWNQQLTDYIRLLWTSPGNRATDDQLTDLCGRRVINRAYLDDDISRMVRQWQIADAQQNGGGTAGGFVAPTGPVAPFQDGMQQMAAAAASFGAASAPSVAAAPPAAAPPTMGMPAAPAAPQAPGVLLQAAAPDMAALAAQQQSMLAAAGAPPAALAGMGSALQAAAAPVIPGHPGGLSEFGPGAGPAGVVPGPSLPAVPPSAAPPQAPAAAPGMAAPPPAVSAPPALPGPGSAEGAVAFNDLANF